ncbi:MAG: NADH-quinone oxidoreductase subunit NuoK [bacterium]
MTAWTAITLNHYLALSGALFTLGVVGVIMRRNILVIYMCLEMMLNAALLAVVAFSRFAPVLDAQAAALFMMAIAAAEAAVGLAIIVVVFRLRRATDVNALTSLRF